ncbi:hypothetical protein QYE76_054301 [Lolium multiflorum]|uniref:DUF4283 domain-containing protein n=1 Tax=Lolium multiflorum TaxID=4521 RepID=A0AAD8WKP7_LOLMU|nr:hypothetical protein QYE76_054301 [Lolium multiflorum]
MASPARAAARGGRHVRAPSRSPAKAGADDLAAGLSAKMGDLLLTEKEAAGLIIKGTDSSHSPQPRWAMVGMVCSLRKLVIGALEKAMQRAWGLHRPATFRDIGDNRFVVRFSSEGDRKHVAKNGPWQFDFHAVLLKDWAGSADMVFNSMDIWVRVLDLPMDMMNRFYGELFGNWVGKFISVDVDEDGYAWGKDLRIRATVRVDQPLLRGVSVRRSEEDVEGSWFDLKYEKVPHFCFDCGCVVHPMEGCSAAKEEDGMQQWGEWLRASPRKSFKSAVTARPSVSSSSYGNRSFEYEGIGRGGVSIRDVPPRRNLSREFSQSSSSRTGAYETRGKGRGEAYAAATSEYRHWARDKERTGDTTETVGLGQKGNRGTFQRRARGQPAMASQPTPSVPLGTRKRGPKQVWLPVSVQVVEEGSSESAGKRQRTSSVFERIEDPTGEFGGQRGSVFDRMVDPAADPARQGRRDQ